MTRAASSLRLHEIIKLEDRYGATVGGPGGLRVRRGTKALVSRLRSNLKTNLSSPRDVTKLSRKR